MKNHGMKPIAKKGMWSRIGMVGVLAMGLAVPMQAEASESFDIFWTKSDSKITIDVSKNYGIGGSKANQKNQDFYVVEEFKVDKKTQDFYKDFGNKTWLEKTFVNFIDKEFSLPLNSLSTPSSITSSITSSVISPFEQCQIRLRQRSSNENAIRNTCILDTGATNVKSLGGSPIPLNNQQPTTNNQQPTTNNQQPTTNNQQPTTNVL